MADNDHTLLGFIDSLRELLDGCVRGEPFDVLPTYLVTPAASAWEEVKPVVANVRDWLASAQQISREVGDQALSMVGLAGAQLQLKLEGYFQAVGRGYRRRLNSYISWVKGCLRWANIILGSLSKAVVACEPLKEFKEVVEAALDYTGAASRQAKSRGGRAN